MLNSCCYKRGDRNQYHFTANSQVVVLCYWGKVLSNEVIIEMRSKTISLDKWNEVPRSRPIMIRGFHEGNPDTVTTVFYTLAYTNYRALHC